MPEVCGQGGFRTFTSSQSFSGCFHETDHKGERLNSENALRKWLFSLPFLLYSRPDKSTSTKWVCHCRHLLGACVEPEKPCQRKCGQTVSETRIFPGIDSTCLLVHNPPEPGGDRSDKEDSKLPSEALCKFSSRIFQWTSTVTFYP